MADRFSSLLFRSSLAGCLLGFVAAVYRLAGLAGFAGVLGSNVCVAAAFAAAAVFFLYAFFAGLRQTDRLGRALGLAILAIIAIETLLSLAPPSARVTKAPIAYSYNPMLLDMLYAPWTLWNMQFVAKFVHALFGYLTGLSLYAYLSRRMNAIYGLLGFLFFVSIPVVLRLSHWADVDLGVAFYSTATLLCLLRWREEKDSGSWLLLAALSAGFAAATQPNGLVAAGLSAFLFLITSLQEPRRGFARIAAEIALFAAAGALACLPWLAQNRLQAATSFFLPWAGFAGLETLTKGALFHGESWWRIAALPLRIFFIGRDDDPHNFAGVLSPLLLVFLPWAFKGKWLGEKRLLIGFTLLYFGHALWVMELRARYLLPVVPPLVALAVYGVFNAYLSIKRPAYLFAGLIFFAALHGLYLWRYFAGSVPLG